MTTNAKKSLSVAIAVLTFGDKLLLTTRHAHTHQGDKLEFVGGKIEQGETPITALHREVQEEIGLDIRQNRTVKLGKLCHDYDDRVVTLYVYWVELSDSQYLDCKDKKFGQDNQPMAFYDKSWVVRCANMPTANQPILDWLSLPSVLIISQNVQSKDNWLTMYAQNLPKNALFYARTGLATNDSTKLIEHLTSIRPDVRWVLTLSDYRARGKADFVKLNRHELSSAFDGRLSLPDVPLFVGVHDEREADMANALARTHRICGALVSPVKPTQSHPDAVPLGFTGLQNLADKLNMPVIALGGLHRDDLERVHEHGAVAVSGIRGIL